MNLYGVKLDVQVAMLVGRLVARHAPDWLERVGTSPGYAAATVWVIAGGMAITLIGRWDAWWMVVPYVVWKAVTSALPEVLWQRSVKAPRWAHEQVQLQQQEVEILEDWAQTHEEGLRLVKRYGLPKTGRQLWALIERLALTEDLSTSMRRIRKEQ